MMGSKLEDVDAKHRVNAELYDAIMTGNMKKVAELCQSFPERALYIASINDDTVLHMATYAREEALVEKLLDELPEDHLNKLTLQNGVGNTILHETATSKHGVVIAEKLLKKAPGLLGMRNHNGESVLYRAARFGKTDMFSFFADKLKRYDQASLQSYLQRSDKTNILHIAILNEHFDLALQIARDYKHLTGEKDSDGMTGLQLLACKPSGFKQEREDGFVQLVKSYCSSTWRDEIQKQKQKYESAVALAKFLVKKDTSWEATHSSQSKPGGHKYWDNLSPAQEHLSPRSTLDQILDVGGTPLLLATKSGCMEIVEEIIKTYPQAIEYIDSNGRNILHVSIEYRRLGIFELLKKKEVAMERLIRQIDNDGNTILHSVGIKRKDFVSEKMEGPALLLQQEMLWFERVKSVTPPPPYFMHHRNNNNLTPYALLTAANSELRSSAREWLRNTAEGCSVVAVLIATVAFAAAYTVPGGPNQSTGFPVLLNRPFFVVFTVTDVLSLTFALTSVVAFLSILSSPFRFEDFEHALPNKLMVGFTFLFLSVAMMMIAFGATIILMIYNKESWKNYSIHSLLYPSWHFCLILFPLYSSLSKPYKYILEMVPPINRVLTTPWMISTFSKCCKPQTTDSHIP